MDYDIVAGSVLHLVVSLRGGNVKMWTSAQKHDMHQTQLDSASIPPYTEATGDHRK